MQALLSNVRDLCTVLTAVNQVPGVEHVLIEFSPEGMMLYAKPVVSPILFNAFWNRSMFQDYHCTATVSRWVLRSKLADMRKNVTRDVKSLYIVDVDNGYKFSGERRSGTGQISRFEFNLFECIDDTEPFSVNINFNWHVHTLSTMSAWDTFS